MQKDPTKPAVYIPIPVFHTGTVKEVSGNLLVITSFELENPNYTGTGNLISEGDWNTYLSYISDEDIDYTFAPYTNKQNINWHIEKSAYTVDVNGYSGLEFRLRHKRHTWYPGMIINTATTARKKSHGFYDPDIIISIFTCIILDSVVL